ncbi:UNVERIFIED_CONTAM: hypothetical protein FKN15_030298 [Acipenser sinensis]
MLKFRADRRVSHNDRSGTFRHPVSQLNAEETHKLQQQLPSNPDMSGKRPVSITSESASNHGMVSDLEPNGRTSRSSKKAVTFGKRSNSMRRNPKAEVMKQGWLYKQASNGVKQWNKRWFVLTDHCLFYYKDEKEEAVLGSIPLLSFWISLLQPSDNINRKHAFKISPEGYWKQGYPKPYSPPFRMVSVNLTFALVSRSTGPWWQFWIRDVVRSSGKSLLTPSTPLPLQPAGRAVP